MTKPNAEYQRAHRERRAAERDGMIAALTTIRDRLGADKSEWANGIREVIDRALVKAAKS